MPGERYDFVADAVRYRGGPERSVLEVGCGAQQYRSDTLGGYVGLDLPTSRYIDQPPAAFARAEQLPFRDRAFDLVFGVAVFNLLEDVVEAFADARRVLRTGGSLLVFDYQKHVCERLDARGAVAQIWGPDRLRSLLVAAGFTHVQDRSGLADRTGGAGIARRYLRRGARGLGRPGIWLIMEAGT